jgi:hypothetical protein
LPLESFNAAFADCAGAGAAKAKINTMLAAPIFRQRAKLMTAS